MSLATYAAAVERLAYRVSALERAPDANDPQALWQLIRDTVRDFADVAQASERTREEQARLRAADELMIEQHYGTAAPDGLALIGELVERHGVSVFTNDGLAQLATLHADIFARANR